MTASYYDAYWPWLTDGLSRCSLTARDRSTDGGTSPTRERGDPVGEGGHAERSPVIVNLWRYRAYILKNALSDVRYRYAGSAMGIAWNVITPLAQILIYSVVFSQIMVTRLTGLGSNTSFALYLCAGLLPWGAFADCVLRGTNAFIENAHYLKKLPIPEQVFVAKNAAAATLFLGISMAVLGLVTVSVGGALSLAWLGVPLALLLFQGFGFGLGLLFGTLNVFVRDIGHALMIGLQLWMWVTPVVYVETILPARVQSVLPYNPAYAFIDGLHTMIVGGEWPRALQWTSMLFWASAAPVAGYLILRRLRPELRDVL